MKFSKYNNPNKRKYKKPARYSAERREELRNELFRLLSEAKDDREREAIIKAYRITLNP